MAGRLERIGDGGWRLAGDLKRAMNVFLIADGEGVTQYDAGTKAMAREVARAAAELGGLRRIASCCYPSSPCVPGVAPHEAGPATRRDRTTRQRRGRHQRGRLRQAASRRGETVTG